MLIAHGRASILLKIDALWAQLAASERAITSTQQMHYALSIQQTSRAAQQMQLEWPRCHDAWPYHNVVKSLSSSSGGSQLAN